VTLTALWGQRWPITALPECTAALAGAEAHVQADVRAALPCDRGGPGAPAGTMDACPAAGACLTAKRKAMGSLLYDRENLTRPRSSASSMFPRELWEPLLLRHEAFQPHWRKPFGTEHRYGVCSAWDLAWSERTGGDWLVKMTGIVDRHTGKRRIIDIRREQGLSFLQQIELIVAEQERYPAEAVVIESDAAQKIWLQYIRDIRANVPVLPHSNAKKADLVAGIPSLVVQLETQRWELPYQSGTFHHDNAEVFLSECESFGWTSSGKLEGVGQHDDTISAFFHLSFGLDRLVGQTPHRQTSPAARGARL